MTDEKRNLFAFAFGDTPEEAKRRAAVKFLVAKFKRTGDMATLAELAQLDPPGGLGAAGRTIRTELLNKRPDEKAYRDTFWRDLDRVFQYLRGQGYTVDDSYAKLTEIFFNDKDRPEPKSIESIRTQHNRWLKSTGQNF